MNVSVGLALGVFLACVVWQVLERRFRRCLSTICDYGSHYVRCELEAGHSSYHLVDRGMDEITWRDHLSHRFGFEEDAQ